MGQPGGDVFLGLLAAGDRKHERNRVIRCHGEVSIVERAEHSQRNPGEPLVAIRKWMISRNVYDEDGSLVDEFGVELHISEPGLRRAQR